MSFRLAYIRRDDARDFVRLHHRHHRPPRGAVICLGCWEDGRLVGVAFLGRPSSPELQKQGVWECTRVATDGTEHANSALYGYVRRVHQLLAGGGSRLITYTLPEEGGASLRGAGWICEGEAGGGDWGTRARRTGQGRLFDAGPQAPTGIKLRWRAEP